MSFAELRKKLAELNHLDVQRRVFASNVHQYLLNPPLSPKRLTEIENLIGVELPEQYRMFVTEFADGGAGPGAGIVRLEGLLDTRTASPSAIGRLRHPFPVPHDVAAMRKLGFSPPGVLWVADMGSGGSCRLVVSGTDRGFVWIANPDGDWSPELRDESHLTGDSVEAILDAAIKSPKSLKLQFLDWYGKWVDDSLDALRRHSNS